MVKKIPSDMSRERNYVVTLVGLSSDKRVEPFVVLNWHQAGPGRR